MRKSLTKKRHNKKDGGWQIEWETETEKCRERKKIERGRLNRADRA